MGEAPQSAESRSAVSANALPPTMMASTISQDLIIRGLVRLTLHQVAYHRGIFPPGQFKWMELPQLDGIRAPMLRPENPSSVTFVSWVELGVMDALKRRHLRALRFGISLDEAGRQQVIEEFEFSFDYGRDGSIAAVNVGVAAARMENRTCGKRAEESEQPIPARPAQRPEEDRSASSSLSSKMMKSVQYQAISMVRRLIITCQTLAELPEESSGLMHLDHSSGGALSLHLLTLQRAVYMKLVYTDECPQKYQAPMFRDDLGGYRAEFAEPHPLSVILGDFTTESGAVRVGVMSLLDPTTELVLSTGGRMKETMEQQPQMGGPGATGGAGGATREGSEADEEVPADFREGEQGAGLASSLVLVTQPPLTQHSASAPFCPTNILVEAAPHPLPAGSAGTTGSQQPYGAIGGASLSPGKGLLVGGREHKRGSSPPEANGPTALLVSGASGGDAEKLPTFGSSATSVLEQRRQREKGESAGASGCHLYCAESGLTEQPGNACIEQLPPRGQGGLKAGSCHGAAANAGGILCHRLVATHPVAPIMCAERGRSTARGEDGVGNVLTLGDKEVLVPASKPKERRKGPCRRAPAASQSSPDATQDPEVGYHIEQVRLICKKAGITQALSVEWVAEQLPGVPAPQIVQALQELGVVLQQSGSQGGDTQPQQYGDQSIIPCSEETEAERERADVVGAGQEEQNQIDKSFGAEILLESEEKTGGIEREGAEKENGLGAGWENGLASGDGDDESMVPETQSLITSRSGLIAAWDKASLPGLRACGSRVDDVAFVHSPRDATKAAIAAIDVCELQGDTAEQADDGGRLPLEESIPASGAGDESACRSRAQVEAGTPSTGRASVVGGRGAEPSRRSNPRLEHKRIACSSPSGQHDQDWVAAGSNRGAGTRECSSRQQRGGLPKPQAPQSGAHISAKRQRTWSPQTTLPHVPQPTPAGRK